MRIVSWNCNNKFREKYKEVLALKADVYVIAEPKRPSADCFGFLIEKSAFFNFLLGD